MEIKVDKEKNTISIGPDITLDIIIFSDVDVPSMGNAVERAHEALQNGNDAIIIYFKGYVSYLNRQMYDLLEPHLKQISSMVREAYGLPKANTLLGSIRLDGIEFMIHYKMSAVTFASIVRKPHVGMYRVTSDITLVGDEKMDELVTNNHSVILAHVENLK